MLNFIASLQIPKDSGLTGLVYSLLRGLYNFVGSYGMAVILFTLALRLILLPMDFANKYFTKRNSLKMAELKDEDLALKKAYANNPMGYLTARKEMYRRNGFNPGMSSLFMLANVVLTLYIFIAVLGCLNNTSTVNMNIQYQQMHAVYIQYEQDPNLDINSDEFKQQINKTYEEYNVSFLWVHNIFRPDTWANKTLSYTEFKNAIKNQDLGIQATATEEEKEAYKKAMYETIMANLSPEHKDGWNGYFILIILAALTTYFSATINLATMKKKKATETKTEAEATYSIRKAKETTSDTAIPQIDPAAMGKVMKIILPIIMVIVTIQATTAFAIYIAAGSLIQTGMSFGVNGAVNKILSKQEKARKDSEPNHPVINPHTRYFKKK